MAKEKRKTGKQDNPTTTCTAKPTLQEPACLPRRSFSPRRQVKDPARLEWHEVTKVAHYYLSVNAMTRLTYLSACRCSCGKNSHGMEDPRAENNKLMVEGKVIRQGEWRGARYRIQIGKKTTNGGWT